jgi:hypothetical protein
MPCSICNESGHNKRTCPSVATIRQEMAWNSSDDAATGVEMWTHPKSGKIYLRDPALEDGEHDIYDYEEFQESGEALHIGWFSPSTGEITFDGEENKVEYEDEEPDIVFCCTGCDKQIIRNSEDHDFSKFDPENEDNWYCVSCPVPEDESDDEEISDEDDWMLTDEQIGSLAPPPAWIWWEGETEELWDGDVPEDFGWSEAELDGRILTYTVWGAPQVAKFEIPISEDDIEDSWSCSCKGSKNTFYTIKDEKMEALEEEYGGDVQYRHKWEYQATFNFFDEPDQTGKSVETENCGQKFCCGELYHAVMADQFAYSCDERDCGCSHSIRYFDYGGYCEDCTEEECCECEETSD